MNDKYSKYFELFDKAMHEQLPSIGNGLYSCLPNDMGRAMGRFEELCKENGVDPQTGEVLTNIESEK